MEEAASPRVLVVVLNWNGADDTLACLASLAAVAGPPAFDVLVIDNGSRRSVVPVVRERFPRVRCLELAENQGYAGGNNVGLRLALAEGYAFAYVLNNDTEVEPGFLAGALAAAGPRVAAVGAKVLALDEPGRLWMTYGSVDYRQSLIQLAGWGERDDGRYDAERDVEWVPGCAALLSCAALADVGLFDERFFAYHEDVDWCTTARERGWRVVYAPAGVVRHRGHRSLGGPTYNSPRKYLSARNSILFARKHATPAQKLKLAASIVLTLPFVFLRRLVSGDLQGVGYKVRGWLDGLRDREVPLAALGLR